jgi:DNA polymerase (family X)
VTPANDALADQLAELAALLRAGRADRFRVRAYERAATTVRSLPVDVADLDPAEVQRLDGIGPAIARMVAEHTATGRIGLLDELRAGHPDGFGALLRLPLIGQRDARALAGVHAIAGVAELRAAAAVPGGLDDLDERLASRALESLRRLPALEQDRAPLPLARRDAQAAATALHDLDGVRNVMVAGAVRRAAEVVGDLAVAVASDDPAATAAALGTSRAVVRVLATDPSRSTVLLTSGRCADVWLAPPEGAGAALLHATGPAGHLAALAARADDRRLDLRPDGLWRDARRVAGATEAGVYEALGLPPVPPELRDRAGTVEAAAAGALPALVTLTDVRGDLHVHTDWSGDGRDSVEDMVLAAAARGLEYVALTDHAENLSINGLPREAVLARRRTIEELRRRHPRLGILDGAELNIDLDGGLDYDLEFLSAFDFCVASIHSHMDRPRDRQTDRILAAIEHPAVHAIGHPTGRLLGRRPGYAIDLEAIVQAAAATGTALEVNGSARRLDLGADMVAVALAAGARVTVTSDAHTVAELANLDDAVRTARRGGATPADVRNTDPV